MKRLLTLATIAVFAMGGTAGAASREGTHVLQEQNVRGSVQKVVFEDSDVRNQGVRTMATSLPVMQKSTSFGASTDRRPKLGRWRGPCDGWWLGENLTPAKWNANPARAERQMRRLVACVFARYAPGNSITALAVADRESGFYPWALNSSSGCAGLFQHITWVGRYEGMLSRWMFGPNAWPPVAFDPRANAIVAAKMVAGFGAWSPGWGPWGV